MKQFLLKRTVVALCAAAAIVLLYGCDSMKEPQLNSILVQSTGSLCQASQCHISTALFTYPPTSGEHTFHLKLAKPCSTCHEGYMDNPTHMNSIIDASASVVFDQANPTGTWNHATQTCGSLACHGDRVW